MFEIQVQGPGGKSLWTVIGPTEQFRKDRTAIDLNSPTLRNLRNDLEKQIDDEMKWWFQKLWG